MGLPPPPLREALPYPAPAPSTAGYYGLRRKRPIALKVPLTYPVLVCGAEVAELWLTRPTAGDVKGLRSLMSESPDPDELGLFAARLAGIQPEEYDAIDLMDDMPRVMEAAAQLLGGPERSLSTGSGS